MIASHHARTGYLYSVPHRLAARLSAGILALIVALAIPGGALAHGEAHHRAQEHERNHFDVSRVHEPGAAVSAPEHDHEHQHPRLDSAVRTRVDAPGLIPRPGAIVVVRDEIVVSVASPVRRDVLPPGDPHTGPPTRLRAPPAR